MSRAMSKIELLSATGFSMTSQTMRNDVMLMHGQGADAVVDDGLT